MGAGLEDFRSLKCRAASLVPEDQLQFLPLTRLPRYLTPTYVR